MTKNQIWFWDIRKVFPFFVVILFVCFNLGRCSSPQSDNGQTSYDREVIRGSRLVRVCKNGLSIYWYDRMYWTEDKRFNRIFLMDGLTPDQFCEKKE